MKIVDFGTLAAPRHADAAAILRDALAGRGAGLPWPKLMAHRLATPSRSSA